MAALSEQGYSGLRVFQIYFSDIGPRCRKDWRSATLSTRSPATGSILNTARPPPLLPLVYQLIILFTGILIRAMDKAAARRRRNGFYLLYLGYAAAVTLGLLAALGLL
jgi:hypothetical protein